MGLYSSVAATAASRAGGAAAVTAAIQTASNRTGVDFSYLLEKAAVESGLDAGAKASSSSATGLYQFIDSTWLDTVRKHGAEHGLGRYAAAITQVDGRATVSDPALRREILDLRKDPTVSALMVAEFTKDNKAYLEQHVGGDIGSTELYMAHFLGPQGAAKFIQALRSNPDQAARELFPEAAAANRGIFYHRDSGQPATLGEIYNRFAAKFGDSDVDGILAKWRSESSGGSWEAMLGRSGVNDPLGGSPLSSMTKLALAALEVPLETDVNRKTAYNSRQMQTAAGTPTSEFRREWSGRDKDA